MKSLTLAAAFGLAFGLASTLASVAASPAQAADDKQLQRLASCQDSWLDWKDDAVRMKPFIDRLDSGFDRSPQGLYTPRSAITVMGLPVSQLYPQSVGMGVGFSVVVDAGFAPARAGIERQLGKPMSCSIGDGLRSCEVQVGDKKTAVLMTGDNGRAAQSLIGCYYFYQQ